MLYPRRHQMIQIRIKTCLKIREMLTSDLHKSIGIRLWSVAVAFGLGRRRRVLEKKARKVVESKGSLLYCVCDAHNIYKGWGLCASMPGDSERQLYLRCPIIWREFIPPLSLFQKNYLHLQLKKKNSI